jgi:8-oxo-dGDP phosphatase
MTPPSVEQPGEQPVENPGEQPVEQPADEPGSWPVVATEDLYRDDWIVALRKDTIHPPGRAPGDPEGARFERWVFEHPGAVIVLAVDEEERVACVRQYRHPASGTYVELPAGLRDADGEEALETAKRELLEEVELEASEWRQLFALWPSPGITAERHVFFLARGLRPGDRGEFELEHEEAAMETLWVPVDDLVDAVLEGRVTQEPISVAVLAYDALRRRGRL